MSPTGSRPLGFTLVEMLVVLGILAFVMTIALPLLSRVHGKAEIATAAREIAVALRETRSAAITHGRAEAFTLDTIGGGFRGAGMDARGRLPRDVQRSLFTTTEERIDDAVGSIRFFADGSSTGGGVRLVQDNRQFDVLVDWLTGRVSIGVSATAR